MSEQKEDYVSIVQNINDDINKCIHDDGLFQLYYLTNGYEHYIKLDDTPIWGSDWDEREEDKDGYYEPLEPFIRKKLMEVFTNLEKIKL